MEKRTKKMLGKNVIQTALGLFVLAFGQYFCVSANIGLAPWDCLAMGLSNYIPLNFGNCCSLVSITIVIIDILMKENIGLGTVMDALLVGQYLNFFRFLNFIPEFHNPLLGVLCMAVGLFFMALGQTIYMAGGLGSGPRDSLMIAIGKRIRKVPISVVSFMIMLVVVLVGWLMGGPIGIGTVFSVVFTGVAMQIVYMMFHIELREIVQLDLIAFVQQLKE